MSITSNFDRDQTMSPSERPSFSTALIGFVGSISVVVLLLILIAGVN